MTYFSVMDEDWTLENVTSDLAALSGRTPEEMIGRDVWEFVRDPPLSMRPYFAAALAAGQDVSGIADYIHVNGGLVPYAYRLRQVVWEDGVIHIAQAGVPLSADAVTAFNRLDIAAARVHAAADTVTEALASVMVNRYMSIRDAIEYTGLSRETLRAWADARVIRRYGTARAVRFRKSELDAAMASEFAGE